MTVSLARRMTVRPLPRIGVWRNNDRRIATVSGDRVLSWLAVISAIGRELANRAVDLVEQRLHLRGIASILTGHDLCDDVAAIGIQRQVQLAPTPAGFDTMLFLDRVARIVSKSAFGHSANDQLTRS
jgi:hypothetical protein